MSQENPPGLDLRQLGAYVERLRPGLVNGPLRAEVIEGGRSNLTYRVTDGSAHWVLRRPPLGHVLATAHDMAREHRVISALGPTSVPVPETVLLCEDQEVLGAPFYLMEYMTGTPYRSASELEPLGPRRTRALIDSLVDTLVALHTVDPEQVGLGNFGRPDGFLERQLRRWAKQLAASRHRELAGMDELQEALGRSLPTSGQPAVVHGDFRLDNVLADHAGRITAVLDWEMSTLGDPLTDMGLLLMYSEQRDVPGSPIVGTRDAPGHPEPDELVAWYTERSGREVTDVNWYAAFAYFKLAVILEGIHYRSTLGQTVGSGFDQIGSVVPLFISNGLTKLRER